MRTAVRTALTLLLLALPALADDPPPSAYVREVDDIANLYLFLDDVQPRDLLDAAAGELSDRLDWLVVDRDGDRVRLAHGDGHPIGEASATTWSELPGALFALEDAVRASGFPTGDLDLRAATMNGATFALDRYSRVLVGDGLDRFDTRLKGSTVGIGVRLEIVDDHLTVVEVFDDGPAELAGLRADDRVERIEGTSTVNMPVREAVRLIRGEPGTPVHLDVARPRAGAFDHLAFALDRADVILPNVFPRVLPGAVGYVRIDHISQKTVHNLQVALSGLGDRHALDQGLVLDLRGNSGGSMKESAGVVDQFVREGLLLATVGRDGRPVENLMARMTARDDGTELRVPVVVLVDADTASGAEIIAGGLLGHERVAMIGQRTFGKGLVQKIYELDEGASLKLTVAEYVLVGDRKVGTDGLQPDVTFGEILLTGEGARYGAGFDLERERVAWGDVVPIVDEKEDWRGHGHDPGDVVLEAARQAVLAATEPSRRGVLAALSKVVPPLRAEQEAHLAAAFEARGIDWSPSTGPGARPEARVTVDAAPDAERPGHHRVRVRVENLGPTTLHRALVRLSCATFRPWDDLVVPIGAIASGALGEGTLDVDLPEGVEAREDLVGVELRADERPALRLPSRLMRASSPLAPRLRVEGRLVGAGADRVAELTVHNLSDVELTGLEADFAWTRDADLELIDQASRRPVLPAKGSVTFTLGVRLGAAVPARLPLRLRVDADRFGRLLSWDLPLSLDGAVTVAQAPEIVVRVARPAAPVGDLVAPIEVRDDGRVASVAVFLNGEKLLYHPGGKGHVDLLPRLPLVAGDNRLLVRVTDDQGIVQQRALTLLGLTSEPGEGITEP